jgi:hypothetical protein
LKVFIHPMFFHLRTLSHGAQLRGSLRPAMRPNASVWRI